MEIRDGLETRRCAHCKDPFVAYRRDKECCSEECSKAWNRIKISIERKAQKARDEEQLEKMKRMKPKKKPQKSITELAVEARQAGMTYGQYVAILEYGMATERRGYAGSVQK